MDVFDNNQKLFLVKLSHTAIWCLFVAAIFAVLYAGVFDRITAES